MNNNSLWTPVTTANVLFSPWKGKCSINCEQIHCFTVCHKRGNQFYVVLAYQGVAHVRQYNRNISNGTQVYNLPHSVSITFDADRDRLTLITCVLCLLDLEFVVCSRNYTSVYSSTGQNGYCDRGNRSCRFCISDFMNRKAIQEVEIISAQIEKKLIKNIFFFRTQAGMGISLGEHRVIGSTVSC